MSPRLQAIHDWLPQVFGGASFTIAPASDDASFRRYFRVELPDGAKISGADSTTTAALPSGATLIVMDAPPDKEDCRPFVRVAELFGAAGVNVPRVLAQDLVQGFLLLTDLGRTTYLDALNPHPGDIAHADPLYRDAIAALIAMQKASRPDVLPLYDRALLERELNLFPEWYVTRQLGKSLDKAQTATMAAGFEAIIANNLAQPQVYVHRDYHSRNLMLASPNPGVLDFQDAVYGPITYDLVSLLRDAYISWPEEQVIDWCIRHWEGARKAGLPVDADFAVFYRDFEWMGAQRQLKVLGIFARLCYRDGKDRYLADQPLVMKYLRATCRRYRELGPLAKLLDELDPPGDVTTGYTF